MNTLAVRPDPTTRQHRDNLADHWEHELEQWTVEENVNRTVIERTTERFFDEGDFTIYAVKNIDSVIIKSRVYCINCQRELDVPNQVEWAA